MLAIALEDRVFPHVHFDVQIAGRPAISASLTLAAQADPISGINAGGDLDGQLAGATHPPLAEAGVAGVLDNGAVPTAAGTGLLELEEALGNPDLPGAAARITGGGRTALGSATTVAGLALGQLGNFDFRGVAEHGLIQIELQLEAQVRAAELLGAGIPTATSAAEDVPEYVAENIAESVATAESATTATAARGLDTRVSVLIVRRPLLGIGQNLTRFLGFLEAFFRIFVIGIAVGVKLHCKSAVGLLDLCFSRGFRYV
jgi:hypothetical protein